MLFQDRSEAGRRLAERLTTYANRPDVLVLALPRGGVPVAFEVAIALNAPLDVFVVRKLGVPGHEELAMGAIASGGVRVLNGDVVRELRIPPEVIEYATLVEREELGRRERAYRDDRPPPQIAGRIVVLIDDGLATGATMRAAVAALREQRPARIVVAVPVGARETCNALGAEVDEIVCAVVPERFGGVGLWYRDFSQTTDEEVRDLLGRAAEQEGARAHGREARHTGARTKGGMTMDEERTQGAGMSPEDRRESGQPGGGQGRVDEVGGSGVYPVSNSEGASGDAQIRGEMSWGQGERGAAGYEDSDSSEAGEIRPQS